MSRPESVRLTRTPPPAATTVRREQVSNDPLLDAPPNPPPTEYYDTAYSQRPMSVADQIEMQTESFLVNCRRKPGLIKDVTSDFSGLQALAQVHAWQAVVNLSSKLLFDNDIKDSSDKVWHLRFEGLFRMKMYDELAVEAGNLLTREESKSLGSNYNMIASMKLLLFEVKVMTGRHQEAVDQLYAFRQHLELQSQDDFTRFWLLLVTAHITNAATRLRNWKGAITELRKLIVDIKHEMSVAKDMVSKVSLQRSLVLVMLRLSRVLLQIGAVKDSTTYFERASAMCTADPNISMNCNIDCHLLLHQGLLLMCTTANPQYGQALDIFTTVMDAERSRVTASESHLRHSSNYAFAPSPNTLLFALFVFDDENLLAAAANNAAICALYVKQITQAINCFEKLIVENPAKYMTDPIVFNLCTLYDLSFAPDISTTKKKVLQKVAVRFQLEDPILHWRSFRLS